MRFGLIPALLSVALTFTASAQQLSVKSATAKRVELNWTATGSSWVVERNAGSSAYQKIGTPATGSFVDEHIDPYGTYRYRVRSADGATPSNEVTVGPPPSGILKGGVAPKGSDAEKYGVNSALAFDTNGDPVVALVWSDPNGDGEYSDTEVRFFRWDRAAYKWTTPVTVAKGSELSAQNSEPVSVAFDQSTGVAAIVYPQKDAGAMAAVSKDGGSTWESSPIAGTGKSVAASSIVTAAGKAYVAVNAEDIGVVFLTADLSADALQWTAEKVPVPAGARFQSGTIVSLALDGNSKPLLAYYAQPEETGTAKYVVWSPGAPPVVAMDTRQDRVDSPNVRIAYGKGKLGLLAAAPLDANDSDHSIYFTSSPDGKTWSAPVKLPVDGPRSSNPPLAVALDSKNNVAALFGSNSGSGDTSCGYPVMDRSRDGVRWTSCGVGHGDTKFGPQPSTLNAAYAGNDKLYVIWHDTSSESVGMGLLMWHEP